MTRLERLEPTELFTKELVHMYYLEVPRGTVEPLSNTLAKVNISYKVTNAVLRPCEDKECNLSLRIGRYASIGKGSRKCVYCSHFCRKPDDNGDDHVLAFQSKRYLERHLVSAQCQKLRDLEWKPVRARRLLSDKVFYAVHNPKYKVFDESVVKFKCSACKGEVKYPNQCSHVFRFYPKRGRSLQDI